MNAPAAGLLPAGIDLRDVQAIDAAEDAWLHVVRASSKLLHEIDAGPRSSEEILCRTEGLRVALQMLAKP